MERVPDECPVMDICFGLRELLPRMDSQDLRDCRAQVAEDMAKAKYSIKRCQEENLKDCRKSRTEAVLANQLHFQNFVNAFLEEA